MGYRASTFGPRRRGLKPVGLKGTFCRTSLLAAAGPSPGTTIDLKAIRFCPFLSHGTCRTPKGVWSVLAKRGRRFAGPTSRRRRANF